MPVSKVINQQSFHDGKVVLYQLENRPKQLWLCRMKVPNGTGYIYRGTGTSDLYEARKVADELLDELRIVNAGEILQRLAGVKVQHGRKQEGPRYRGPSCLSDFIPEGRGPTAGLTGLGVTGAWSERA